MSVELRLVHNLSQFFRSRNKSKNKLQNLGEICKIAKCQAKLKVFTQIPTYINDRGKNKYLYNKQSGERVIQRVFYQFHV